MRTNLPVLAATAAAALVVNLLIPSAGPPAASTAKAEAGVITEAAVRSATLGEDIKYNVYLPGGYQTSSQRYPVIYLLHGRGDSMSAWTQLKGRLDDLIATGEIPPTIAVMPDAPWSDRASYYVDSAYKGEDPGRPVETALIHDLVPHVDAAYRTIADRTGRAIAGYSMGGSGALRYSMVHADLFGAAIVLSPAVYSPLPPAGSSAREFGAYGKGKAAFSEAVYRRLNYPAAFEAFAGKGLQSHLFIAVGDDEYKNPEPKDYQHDLDFEAHVVFNQAVRVPNLTSEFRVVDGGHDWDVWGPTFVEGAKYIFQFIGKPPATPMKAALSGTAGEDRAGGIAVDPAGNTYEAIAAEGSIDGQPYAGGKDVALTKYGPDGTKLWSRELGTSGTERAYGVALDPQGRPVVTGYTTGDLDGNHPGNPSDDAFATRYDGNGNREWITQFGTTAADRSYSVATDSAGGTYLGGYTKGNLGGTNLGDKDAFVAKLDGDGKQVWLRQVGSAAEEKGMAVVAGGESVYLGGMTAGALGEPLGGLDGFVARYDQAGTANWLKQLGTTEADEVWALAADGSGGAFLTGYTAGDFAAPLAGDKDLVVARVDSTGVVVWKDQLGTAGNDKGAAITPDGAGGVFVAGFTDGQLQTGLGKFDVVLARYAQDQSRTWVRQFGTTEDDGADAFAEANLFVAGRAGTAYLSGLTAGDTSTQPRLGNGDVFHTTFDAEGSGH
ncbi:esterase [Kribbella qitaiheensis]|uniref:Esterase n=1 Tax=Kribbella qitaiheensis TaxID=1544730 RepID=A0A7G6X2P2_9ACTN|nr:alpha/beta hydrolase-fold protein [Kribbella qitaiheensis]QNE20507.1 esterase [Kribbella qitaiheensis]